VVTNADEVLAWFRESGAVHDGHFRYTSGRHGDTYFEKFQVLQHPEYTVKLCALIAQRFKASGATLVAGPTTGGVILGFEVARQLGLRSIFAERAEGGGRTFGRGFRIQPGERTLVVDDVLTTGGSVREVLEAVRAAGGEPIGVAVLVDRTGGKTDFGVPFFACMSLEVASYPPDECPLCTAGVPLTET
jgi:orotate phosphoribosyltransferase